MRSNFGKDEKKGGWLWHSRTVIQAESSIGSWSATRAFIESSRAMLTNTNELEIELDSARKQV